jgi:hypothetical protein
VRYSLEQIEGMDLSLFSQVSLLVRTDNFFGKTKNYNFFYHPA